MLRLLSAIRWRVPCGTSCVGISEVGVGISEAGLYDPALPSNTQSQRRCGRCEQNEQGTACRSARLVWLADYTWHDNRTMKLLASWCKCRATRVLRMNLTQACWNRACTQSRWVCSNCVCIALQVRWVGTMWKLWLHVALLCVMLVFVGLMTRGVNQVVSSMRGHLDMLMGHPWHHGRCGLLVLVLGHVAYLMHLDAVKTHTCHGCIPIVIEVMGGAVASTCAAA